MLHILIFLGKKYKIETRSMKEGDFMKLKKLIAIFLSMSMVFAVGCSKTTMGISENNSSNESLKEAESSNKDNNLDYLNNDSQFPIVNEPITIKIMANMTEVMPEYDTVTVWKEYEEMTGIKIEWESVGSQSIKEKVKLAFASNEMPDAFLKCKVSNSDLLRFGEQGMLLDLAPYLEEYAPNIWAFINENEEVKKGITFPNGAIYGIPAGIETPAVKVSKKIFINKTWMDKLGLKMPTTTQEFYEVLKAFKEKDPNGNNLADEIPFSSDNLTNLYDVLRGSFGLGNRGTAQQLVDFDETTQGVRFIPTAPEYKECMEYMNQLYSEGLIDYEIFTMNASQFIGKASQNLIGCFVGPNMALLPTELEENYVGLEVALKGPNGDQLYAPLRTGIHSTGAFVIPTSNQYPEATLRWIDYFFSDEGSLMYHYGIEGETYEKKEDGTYDFIQSVYDEIGGNNSFDSVVSKYVSYAGGNNPTIIKEPFFAGAEMQPIPYQAALNMMPFVPEEVWPDFTFTLEENERLSVVKTDLNKYFSQMRTEFISGKTSLDTWDNYLQQMEKMGLQEFMQLYNQAYERYIAD